MDIPENGYSHPRPGANLCIPESHLFHFLLRVHAPECPIGAGVFFPAEYIIDESHFDILVINIQGDRPAVLVIVVNIDSKKIDRFLIGVFGQSLRDCQREVRSILSAKSVSGSSG